eukprot:546374-Ditylum_brightwellii.AAC.1
MARFRADGTEYQYEELAMRRSRGKVLVVVSSQAPLIFCIRKQVLPGEAGINNMSWLIGPG